MKDDAFSKFVREAKGLHPDWRVYLFEAAGDDKIRLTGALARPATEHDDREAGSPVWFKPMKGKAQMTVSRAEYRAMCDAKKKSGTSE